MQPFLDSTSLVADPDALNERLDTEGYLFVRGLLPRAAVLDVRRAVPRRRGGQRLARPRAPRGRRRRQPGGGLHGSRSPGTWRCSGASTCSRRSTRSSTTRRSMGFFERLFGEPVLVHPLFVMRNIFPQRPESTTPAHQDYVHIQGTPRTYTVWMPLGDCPLEQGSLVGGGRLAPGRRPGLPGDERLGRPGGRRPAGRPLARELVRRGRRADLPQPHGAQGAAEPDRTAFASRWTRATSG